ncbi:hypothetical protein C1X89_22630 [Pseudomonas sp. GP01-A8]|nr:hypothetical protein C1X90_24500 [Pseudomonas sp. GP01-A9]PMU25956.1 hypothetical protein C1X88_22315 [Pseudomonas sp. GP01-A13]PMU35105.1 hypothetical protein C1X89_22630 [Pseudomonas sp. GP01-A8]PMU46332.1 hypothetical protein C1X87_26010 [Pseudomonas sp. GP01-A14]PMU60510.1 hypothetical protein C1X86_22915 [Pseudomonas sp. GP01-A3]PMU67141.1 hypothetical protein C1X81_28395 [Pseudomonas sp. FW215-L2]PMU69932.1 hypothetical protein C1X84_24790 [Pseudomonas sp. GP01-A1]PMU76986.1 hypothe
MRYSEFLVGAGLPAMASTRCDRYTEVPASQASQLPHLILTKAHKGKMALICPVPELPNGWVMISAGWL